MIKALASISTAVLAVSFLIPQPLCAQQDPSTAQMEEMCPDVAIDLVLEAKKSIRLADMSSFEQVVAQKSYDLVIDVREPSEYDAGHIPGAINIPRGLIEFKIWPTVGFPDVTDQGQKIFVYCNTGGRASLSGKSLQELGFTEVTVVDMKLTEWIDAGFPIERSH
jgi:rhodanese-related sulfurtransferase